MNRKPRALTATVDVPEIVLNELRVFLAVEWARLDGLLTVLLDNPRKPVKMSEYALVMDALERMKEGHHHE
jgi:hypothetical protein